LFTPERLEGLVAKHNLGVKLGTHSRDATFARIRKLTEVRTWHDYFESYRQRMDPPRTARVTITFSAPDPALALAVARDLGELVAKTQTDRLAQLAAARIDGLRAVAESAAARAARRRENADVLRREQQASPGRPSRQLAELEALAQDAEAQSRAAEGDLFDAKLEAIREQTVGGLVQIVDPGVPLWGMIPRSRRLARQGSLALSVAIVLVVLFVGMFDPTIRDEQDLHRTSLRPLGRVPVIRARPSDVGT
jgi:hypothetical protein